MLRLLREVLTHNHGFVRLLERRKPSALPEWRRQTARVFADYLNPAHLEEVALGCSLAALTGDAARAGDAVRAGYRRAWVRLVGEVLRGPTDDPIDAHAVAGKARRERAAGVVGAAIGAVALARVLAPDAAAAALLRGVAVQAAAQLKALWALPVERSVKRPPGRVGLRGHAAG